MSTIALKTTRAGWKTFTVLLLAGAAAAIFLAAFALPYFRLNPDKLAQYKGREFWIFMHIGAGAVALALGPFALWLGVNRRRLAVHRTLGKIYLIAIGISSIAAYYLAFHTAIGWVFGFGLASLATAWIATSGLAFFAIKRRRIEQHQEWMIRSYVVTFGFVNFRILVGILQATGVGTLYEQLTAASWFCWAMPLVMTELIIQGRKILK